MPGYEVSNQGRVQASALYDSAGRLAIPAVPVATSLNHGYPEVSLRQVGGGRRLRVKVHHLVAAAFIGPRPPGAVVRHLNGDKEDNRLSNLTYGSQAENIADTVAHGRHYYGSRDVCGNGHALTPDNVYASSPGRKCKRCQRARARARHLGVADYRDLL